MALLGKKKAGEEVPNPVAAEARQLARVSEEAYRWLGGRYLWYNKIRNAKKGMFPFLQGKNLEEQMEATRSALILLGRTLNAGMVVAFNSTVDGLGKMESPPEGIPSKIDMPDRNNPPHVTHEQDAVIVCFMPLRFLNQAKMLRDKGKGIDFYTEGLIKKMFFKVVSFYADPNHWRSERLAYFLQDLPEDASLADMNQQLAPLKTELDLLASSLQMFKFATPPRRKEAGTANTLDEAYEISPQDQVRDLYFQSLIINGIPNFLFRYYLTLLAAMKNPKGLRLISNMFQPALAKSEEMRIRFQASFTIERAKSSIRPMYQDFFRKMESQPLVTTVKQKGKEIRKFNYTHKFIGLTSFPRGGPMAERHAKAWSDYLRREVVAKMDQGQGPAILMEISHSLLLHTQNSVQGKLEVVAALRSFADEQAKLGEQIVKEKQKKLNEAKRNKLKTARKFKSTEQFDMVKTVEEEAAQLEAEGLKEIETANQAIEKRKQFLSERAQSMEDTAKEEGDSKMGHAAADIFNLAEKTDEAGQLRAQYVQFLVAQIQEDNDLLYLDYYKNIYTAMPSLFPTEKIVLRKAVASRVDLDESEMQVSAEDSKAYEIRIAALKTKLNEEAPGTLENRFMHGPVNTEVEKLLNAKLTQASLGLLLSLPVNKPNKPPEKLPAAVVEKLLALNKLSNPFADNDVLLPNVGESQPVSKRINFNRLQKLI